MTMRAGRALTVTLTDWDARGTAAHPVGAHLNGQPPALTGADPKGDAGAAGGRASAAGRAVWFGLARTLPPATSSRRTIFLAFRKAPDSLGRQGSSTLACYPTRLDNGRPRWDDPARRRGRRW